MNKFKILYCDLGTQPIKGVPIAFNREASGDDYGNLYSAMNEFLGVKDSRLVWTHSISIYNDQTTPQGHPYTYDLCMDGGMYFLWKFGGSRQELEASKSWLRHSFDVVSLEIKDVRLIEWQPPAPFQAIDLPDWVAK